jgi:hypothetical protein
MFIMECCQCLAPNLRAEWIDWRKRWDGKRLWL